MSIRLGVITGSPGEPGFRIAGFMVMSFEVVDSADPEIPNTYIDLKISSVARYKWVSRLMADKLDFFKEAEGDTRAASERALSVHDAELQALVDDYLKTL